ncbi:MAG: 4-alpha-glucanotransferase, partial [Spirochaetaceae bacterium]|nr:4-alpha-glucanotransferase [Spirochaetaceae bacterium]
MIEQRAAGILLAVSSLDGHWGIGAFGKAARRWVDFLAAAGQKYWQILPLGPTGWGDSPYQSPSAFALSPYYIDPEALAEGGLLTAPELETLAGTASEEAASEEAVDYAALYQNREPLLRRAFSRFRPGAGYARFIAEQDFWLADYSLFMAVKRRQGARSWLEWDEPLLRREEEALAHCRRDYAADLSYYSFEQYLAFSQWRSLKAYANDRGVSIIGDMPIYTAMDSADTWAGSDYFQLDERKRPLRVAGCPPDAFAGKGQLWGNPLYRWDRMAETGFAWWIARIRAALSLYDVLRIDHFRGFESYYSIDAAAPDAVGGEWVKGPGLAFINAVNGAFPGAAIIAEDLGYLTPEVRALLRASGFPGMKVLQFAFDTREPVSYMPYTYERNCVVYTGTHDNDTALGWFGSARPEDAALARDYLGLSGDAAHGEPPQRAFIRAAFSSVADLAIIPMQDHLGLGSAARMNRPSTLGGSNWRWR